MCRAAAAGRGVRVVGFFFQAEDGIRDVAVTGVQTCALPISCSRQKAELAMWKPRILPSARPSGAGKLKRTVWSLTTSQVDSGGKLSQDPGGCGEIGRASCRERV